MGHDHLIAMVDEALERFGTRELVAGPEILDFLLDMRIALHADDPFDELLQRDGAPAPS